MTLCLSICLYCSICAGLGGGGEHTQPLTGDTKRVRNGVGWYECLTASREHKKHMRVHVRQGAERYHEQVWLIYALILSCLPPAKYITVSVSVYAPTHHTHT